MVDMLNTIGREHQLQLEHGYLGALGLMKQAPQLPPVGVALAPGQQQTITTMFKRSGATGQAPVTPPLQPFQSQNMKHISSEWAVDQFLSIMQSLKLAPFNALKHSLGDDILAMDAGFKLERDGIMTIKTSTGFVVAQWYGTSSTKDLEASLKALNERMEALGFKVTHIYADNIRAILNVLRKGFIHMGLDCFPGDLGGRLDIWHSYQVIRQTFMPNHQMGHQSITMLSERFKVKHPRQASRFFYPPPAQMLAVLVEWALQFCDVIDVTGEFLFTVGTVKALERFMLDIISWFLSGE